MVTVRHCQKKYTPIIIHRLFVCRHSCCCCNGYVAQTIGGMVGMRTQGGQVFIGPSHSKSDNHPTTHVQLTSNMQHGYCNTLEPTFAIHTLLCIVMHVMYYSI